MDFSFSLARHRLQAAQESARLRRLAFPSPPPRPQAPLVWVHGSRGIAFDGVRVLLDDLRTRHPGLVVLATGDAPVGDLAVPPPADTTAHAQQFLDHWTPDAILWAGTDPFPILWTEAISRRIPLFAVECDPASLALPLVRPLSRFQRVLTLRPDPRLGGEIRPLGPLARVPRPPAAPARVLEALAALLATRPVWLAAATPGRDIAPVLSAHGLAAQLSHRLLLLLEVTAEVEMPALRARLRDDGWNVAVMSEGEDPGSGTQVYLVDEPGAVGLWARLASITYLGGSLDGPVMACDPMIPASLGSVVLHGPQVEPHAGAIARLREAQAAWRVTDATELGRAVERFLAPEKAAEMAHAAWGVTTEGAEATAWVLDEIDDCLVHGSY